MTNILTCFTIYIFLKIFANCLGSGLHKKVAGFSGRGEERIVKLQKSW